MQGRLSSDPGSTFGNLYTSFVSQRSFRVWGNDSGSKSFLQIEHVDLAAHVCTGDSLAAPNGPALGALSAMQLGGPRYGDWPPELVACPWLLAEGNWNQGSDVRLRWCAVVADSRMMTDGLMVMSCWMMPICRVAVLFMLSTADKAASASNN